jgi:adenylylsulfate kinase
MERKMGMDAEGKYVIRHDGLVTKHDRETLNGHKGMVLWFTGLSGSGKSTIASHVEKALFDLGMRTYLLDGDTLRCGLNRDLGFSARDRKENLRRIGEVAKLFVDAGIITLCAFISPYRSDRENVRRLFPDGTFLEIYVKCDLEECMRRDPKGLYKKARQGLIKGFTGLDAPYEEPLHPDLIIDTTTTPLNTAVSSVLTLLGVSPPTV